MSYHNGRYKLEGKIPVPCPDLLEWGMWLEKTREERCVGFTKLPGNINISTMFIGLDMNYGLREPALFETMIFGGDYDGYCKRYSTWLEAEAGHQKAIELIFEVNES